MSGSSPSRSRLGEGLYSAAATEGLYGHLARSAEDVLRGGIHAIVDATFLERAQRARFAELAAGCGVRMQLILCEAPEPVLRARIMDRERAGRDASEADLKVLAWQAARAEPLGAGEGIDVIRVDTVAASALELALGRVGSPSDQN